VFQRRVRQRVHQREYELHERQREVRGDRRRVVVFFSKDRRDVVVGGGVPTQRRAPPHDDDDFDDALVDVISLSLSLSTKGREFVRWKIKRKKRKDFISATFIPKRELSSFTPEEIKQSLHKERDNLISTGTLEAIPKYEWNSIPKNKQITSHTFTEVKSDNTLKSRTVAHGSTLEFS
jgi:hypothetical protein